MELRNDKRLNGRVDDKNHTRYLLKSYKTKTKD